MDRKDQMPAEGCDRCGAWAGNIQSLLRKRLVREADSWLCKQCAKEEREREK